MEELADWNVPLLPQPQGQLLQPSDGKRHHRFLPPLLNLTLVDWSEVEWRGTFCTGEEGASKEEESVSESSILKAS